MLLRHTRRLSITTLIFMIGLASIGGAINDDPALVLYLSFEEGKGDKALDQSANKIEGVLKNGVEWTKDGKVGNAVSFKGTAHIEFPEIKVLDIINEITIEGWIFPLAVQGDSNLFGRRTPANQGGYTMQWTAGKIETWIHIGGWQGTSMCVAQCPDKSTRLSK